MSKIFIIGFGAQKGGTTWLADNLSKAGVMFPWGKEARILHHTFDKNNSEHVANERAQNSIDHTYNRLAQVHAQNTESIIKIISNPKKSHKLATTLQASEKKYQHTLNLIWRNASKALAATGPEGYAQQVSLRMNQKEKEHAGDITPIYCGIAKENMNKIYQCLEKNKISPKSIFIARDPLDRVWSSAKMMAKRNPEKFKTPEDTYKFFENHFTEEGVIMRTRYEHTLNNLKDSYFNKYHKVLFYESLFNQETWNSVLEFINLKTEYQCNFDKVNASPEIQMGLSQEIKKEVIKFFSDTYIYMRKEYPMAESLWENSYKILDKAL